MLVDAHVTPELEQELLDRQPWMHPYRLADDVIVGWFKGVVPDDTTVCVSTSAPAQVSLMRFAFDRFMASDPSYDVRELVKRVGPDGSYLDIACATGWYSHALADLGVQRITGVEIRREQVEQGDLIRRLGAERFAAVRFEHDPTSADDPSFRAGESYAVVLSLGLLYHLTDPFAHIRNLRRLATRAVLLNTLTHARERGYWLHVHEDAAWMSKAWSGVSWIPHFADVPDLLHAAGFSRVEGVTRPALQSARARDARTDSRVGRMLLPGAFYTARGLMDKRALRHEEIGVEARYYTYLATV